MNQIAQKFQNEIEIERMWLASQQGSLIFFSILPLSVVVVFILWESASHPRLLIWLSLINCINYLRWVSLRFFYRHKDAIEADVRRIQQTMFAGSICGGLSVALGNFWFLDPAAPISMLAMSIFSIIVGVGAVLSWFFHIPAVLAILIPVAGSFPAIFLFQGDRTGLGIGLVFLILLFVGYFSSVKLARMLNHTLYLNFENLALRREAERANAAKTRFLAAASHDLRQPIHALGLFFSELSDRVHSPETAAIIAQVEDSIGAINSMLNALLDVSKLDAGVVKPAIAPLDLSELFDRLQMEFNPLAMESGNTLAFRPSAARVLTDPMMLERMLRNLIGNALRYTRKGRVLVAARPRNGKIEIQVLDSGPGIPEDQLDEIFVEFHQLHNPVRDRRQGLGLGLAIVRRLAKLLHHEIKVKSRVGHGSCFSITVPPAGAMRAREPAAPLASIYLRPGYLTLAGRRILVLDDDQAILASMQGLLGRWGCDVVAAASPSEAMKKVAADDRRLELLIVDYRLSDKISGIDAARSIQNTLGYPLAVLIITGDTGPERLREADASGYPLLHKPVQPAKLRSTLQYLMNCQHAVSVVDNSR